MQCSNCSIRFNLKETRKYNDHLDWHFQQNHNKNKRINKLEGDEEHLNFFEKQQILREKNRPPILPSCPAGLNSIDVKCVMCDEKFDQFFNDDCEEWYLRNAVRVMGIPLHPACSNDFKKNYLSE